MSARASWLGHILAETEHELELEGFVYFPPDSVHLEYLRETGRTTECPWKGRATLYDVVVDDQVHGDAAWCYPDATGRARRIRGFFAFWKDVAVER